MTRRLFGKGIWSFFNVQTMQSYTLLEDTILTCIDKNTHTYFKDKIDGKERLKTTLLRSEEIKTTRKVWHKNTGGKLLSHDGTIFTAYCKSLDCHQNRQTCIQIDHRGPEPCVEEVVRPWGQNLGVA